jgi:hypothetical protein
MNDRDGNAKAGVDTGWNFDRAGDFLPACSSRVSDRKTFAILAGCQSHQEKA